LRSCSPTVAHELARARLAGAGGIITMPMREALSSSGTKLPAPREGVAAHEHNTRNPPSQKRWWRSENFTDRT
jgi:hypothetical protein